MPNLSKREVNHTENLTGMCILFRCLSGLSKKQSTFYRHLHVPYEGYLFLFLSIEKYTDKCFFLLTTNRFMI